MGDEIHILHFATSRMKSTRQETRRPVFGSRHYAFCLFSVLCFTGCVAHQLETVDPIAMEETRLEFLKDGQATRDEILLQLGAPSKEFEAGRIWAYRLDRKYRVVESRPGLGWKRARFSLILVFDADKILEKHNLIRVR